MMIVPLFAAAAMRAAHGNPSARDDDGVMGCRGQPTHPTGWATPENESLWTQLRASGVDLINTDQLDRLAAFLSLSP